MIRKNYLILGILIVASLALLSGVTFYNGVVGGGGTNIFSVLFGWQWLYLTAASIFLLIVAILKKYRSLTYASLIVIATLLIVLIPAQFIYAKHLYITGDGGPAGPDMSCLVWSRSDINGAYGHKFGLCTLMSMPSLNKFIIDRGNFADSTDNSLSYYAMLIINETVIIGGLVLTKRRLYPEFKE